MYKASLGWASIAGTFIGAIVLGVGLANRNGRIWSPSMPSVYIGSALIGVGVMALIAWVTVSAVADQVAGLRRDLKDTRKALRKAARDELAALTPESRS